MTAAHRLTIAVALTVLVGCSAQAISSPSTPPAETPSGTPEPSPTPEPSSPQPSAPPTVAWQPASVPESGSPSGTITIVPGGDGLIAIGFDGGFGSMLWTSADGQTWRDATPDGWDAIGIASVVEYQGMLVGVGRGNTVSVDTEEAAVYLSEDGLHWRTVETGPQLIGQMIDVVATADGLYAVGGVPGADSAGVWHSTDGETWQRTGPDFEHAFLWAIAEGGPGLVAVGWRRTPDPSAAVWTSADGSEWTLSPDPEGFALHEATDVLVADDGTLVMIGSSLSGDGGVMWFSPDGLSWTRAEVTDGLVGRYARTATRTPAGLVAVGGGEDMLARAWLSTDGRSWEPLGDPLGEAYFNAAMATDDGLLLVGATQSGTLETGIDAHAAIWSTALSD